MSEFFMGGGAMQCEWCKSNFANYKFNDSHLEDEATKVVGPSCYHMLSLACIRHDLTDLHQRVEEIAKKIERPRSRK